MPSLLIRLREEYRNSEDAIRNLLVDAPGGQRIPLSSFDEVATWKLNFVTPDGQRFLLNIPDQSQPLLFVQGWERLVQETN